MDAVVAYADSRDTSLPTMVLLLYSVFWIAIAAFLAAIPPLVSRRRAHRHAGMILAIMLFWALAAGGSACATLAARERWSREETVLLESGYYDPREHRHDPPGAPWGLWGVLGGLYGGMALWSLIGRRVTREA
jgi:hypothetical protein